MSDVVVVHVDVVGKVSWKFFLLMGGWIGLKLNVIAIGMRKTTRCNQNFHRCNFGAQID